MSAKWLGFKAYLRSNRLEQALTNNALIMSGFYPHKNTVNKTYTTLESVDSITRGAFDDELLVELTPGFHRISCRYQRPSPFRKSVGTLVSVTYNFEKGKIYIPCGKLLGSKWLLEIKEYTSPENMNKKSISRIKKGFKKYWKKNQKSMSKQVKNPDTPHLMNGKFNL
ncbi:MAG: hypothetical protein JW774_08215 [Candidatus Aureabacteria bacterium]|nr:hypothetical protein [Candidatus Auribacterota bacterium]